MTRRLQLLLVSTLASLMLAGCSTTGAPEQQDRVAAVLEELNVTQGEPVRSVTEFRIDGWRAIDDRHLILTAGRHDHYLVELAGVCPELRSAFRIGLESRTGSLTRLDSILVRSMHSLIDTCQIREIYRLDDID